MALIFRYFLFLVVCTQAFAFDWQGHRGARGLYPENTVGGMREALKYPITTLELDVVISRDNKVVVSHEPWMNPEICLSPAGTEVLDRAINLYLLSYDEIIKYDCGSKVHPRFTHQIKASESKPLLKTLISETENELKKLKRKLSYNVEIKSTEEDEKEGFQPHYKIFTDRVVEELKDLLPVKRFTIQTFDKRVAAYIHEKYPELTLSVLEEHSFEAQRYLKELGFKPQIFSPDFSLLTSKDISFFHSQGVKVIPWTVNTLADLERVKAMGVDGIITDYPNLIPSVGLKKCPQNTNLFDGKCVHVPRHAIPSEKNPGWICAKGFVQRRDRCDKVLIPSHAKLNDDGHTWSCTDGYVRYRSKCRKGK